MYPSIDPKGGEEVRLMTAVSYCNFTRCRRVKLLIMLIILILFITILILIILILIILIIILIILIVTYLAPQSLRRRRSRSPPLTGQGRP